MDHLTFITNAISIENAEEPHMKQEEYWNLHKTDLSSPHTLSLSNQIVSIISPALSKRTKS